MSESIGEPLVCRKCGCSDFDSSFSALASQQKNFFLTPDDEVVVEEFEWEVIETFEDFGTICINCGLKISTGDLLPASEFSN